MIVWITGSAGFLGNRLCKAFVEGGHTVIGLSRRISPNATKSFCIDLCSQEAFTKLDNIIQMNGKPDIVIHAASARSSINNYGVHVESSLLTTANLLDVLSHSSPKLFIYTSTMRVYGRVVDHVYPINENYGVMPETPYAVAKLLCESLLYKCWKQKLRYTQFMILRLPSLYGGEHEEGFMASLAQPALAGEPLKLLNNLGTRDLLHVDDVVNAIIACASAKMPEWMDTMNLGCGVRITVSEWAKMLLSTLHSDSSIMFDENDLPYDTSICADITKARGLLGFVPTPIKESIKRYVDELLAKQR